MRLFRITHQAHLERYDGLGASYQDGGRWNSAGVPALYFACSAAVSLLEMANYTSSPRMMPPSLRLAVYELPDSAPVRRLEASQWPDDWDRYPFNPANQHLGDAWLNSTDALGLVLPSAAVPSGLDDIMLVNPQHPGIAEIRLIQIVERLFNPRAFAD